MYILLFICIILAVAALAAAAVLIYIKRDIRRFSDELDKLKSTDYSQPLKISVFDRDLTRLAVKINEHTELQRRLGAEYEEQKRQLGNVVSGISHDFRTPLTAALGYMQMVEKCGELSERNAQYLSVAIEKNNYLRDLSDDFFEMTKLENNAEPPASETVNISNMVTELLLEQHSWTTEKGIRTDFDIQDGITAETDRHCISRILENLFSNSRKYSVSFFAVSLKKDERIVLTVSNDLEDSRSMDTAKVFEPFYRMQSRTAGGSGLGLYVVKLLCDRLGAEVTADISGDGIFRVEVKL